MKKLYFLLLLTVLTLSLFPLLSLANPFYPQRHVYDTIGALTPEEQASLEQEAKAIAGEVNLYVVFDNADNPDYMSQHGLDRSDDFVLLVVHRSGSTWYYDMHIYGKFYDYINDEEMNAVLDHSDVYGNLKFGNLYDGALAWMRETKLAAGKNWGDILVPAIAVGFVAAAIAVAVVAVKYVTKQKATNYPLSKYAKMDVTDKRDIFINSTVTSYTVSNGNGGGGRSGGGGGGGRHGGR